MIFMKSNEIQLIFRISPNSGFGRSKNIRDEKKNQKIDRYIFLISSRYARSAGQILVARLQLAGNKVLPRPQNPQITKIRLYSLCSLIGQDLTRFQGNLTIPRPPRSQEVATTARTDSNRSLRALGIVSVRGEPCAALPGLQTAEIRPDPPRPDLVERFVSLMMQSTVAL